MPDETARSGEVHAHLVEELRRRYGAGVGIEQLADIVERLMDALGQSQAARHSSAYAALDELARFIHSAHAEIAALRPDEVTRTFLPAASDELDAIVAATSEATNAIMDAAETIESRIPALPEGEREALSDAATRIYEACGFQDITGQRIGKVVRTLKEIETRVDALVGAFGPAESPVESEATGNPDEGVRKVADADLLEGPQLKGQGRSQDEVDKLLASLD